MTIHKEGYRTISLIFVLSVFIILALNYFLPQQNAIHYLLYIVLIVFNGFIIRFFRFPNKNRPKDENAIFCGADGKVVAIEEVEENEFIKGPCIQISVFMSPNNVHINWYPVDGDIAYCKYHPGKFLVAWHPKSSTLNERTSVGIRTKTNKRILVRQIAGAVARRIVCYAKENSKAEQGQQLGFIKFGSRVDHFIPRDAKIKVTLNETVWGGQTVLAEF